MADFKTYTVTNTAKGPRGLHTKTGFVSIEPGQGGEVELTASEYKSAAATGHFEFDTPAPASTELKAAHRGAGSYAVMRGDEVVDGVPAMTKEDADAFNALTDDEKAAYVTKPAA